jgi:hypothetical protein
VYCCGGERSAYCYGGTEGGEGEEEKDGDAAAALPHAVAPLRARQRVFVQRRRGEEGMRQRLGYYVCIRGGARGSAKRGGSGALRRVARLKLTGLLRGAASVP